MSSPSKKKECSVYVPNAELFYFISRGSVLDVSQFYFVFAFFLTVCTQEVVSCFLEYKPDVDDYHTKEVQYEKTLSTTLGLFYFIFILFFFFVTVSLCHIK